MDALAYQTLTQERAEMALALNLAIGSILDLPIIFHPFRRMGESRRQKTTITFKTYLSAKSLISGTKFTDSVLFQKIDERFLPKNLIQLVIRFN